MASSREDVMAAINAVCHNKGGVYNGYSCKKVSWDDSSRGEVDGTLSCWGANITDTRLWEKNGARLFTVRSDNWNEKLGKVSAQQIALLVGNNNSDDPKKDLQVISLEKFLKNAGQYGSYAGLPDGSLFEEKLDAEISIRFQTTFLPVIDEEKATLEFATEAYNYNTMSDDDPKNLLLLCTTQGTSVQQDGAGAKKLFLHRVDKDNVIHRHWLEAERSKHKVGGPQTETAQEKADAVARGKATSEMIGIESMETRFNVLMTIQVPLQQKKKQQAMMYGGSDVYHCMASLELYSDIEQKQGSMLSQGSSNFKTKCGLSTPLSARLSRFLEPLTSKRTGSANAARVSHGKEYDTWRGLTRTDPARHTSEHITVTVVVYNTVAGGVPSEDDVISAIEDMEQLYASCSWTGRLNDDEAGFMKSELTVKNVMDIGEKVTAQPHPDWQTP